MGVLLGGTLSWLNSSSQRNHERKKERREVLLSKYEDLHCALTQVHSVLNQMAMEIVVEVSMNADIPEKPKKEKMEYEKASMLCQFYAPELSENMERLGKHIQDLNRVSTTYAFKGRRDKDLSVSLRDKSRDISKSIKETIETLKSQLSESARSIFSND